MDDLDSYYDSSDDNSSGGGVFGQVLNAVTQLGSTAILASDQPSTRVPYPGPAGSYNAGGYYGGPPKQGPGMLTILLLIGAGFYAFTKLK